MTILKTTTNTNIDISSFFLVGTYTATSEQPQMNVQLLMNQVSGNNSYIAYITRQINGTGSAYESSRCTVIEDKGSTSLLMQTINFPVKSGDILNVYLMGGITDTTTPDVICEFWNSSSSNDASDISSRVWDSFYNPIRTLTSIATATVGNTFGTGSDVAIYSATTIDFTITGLPSLSGVESLWFTAKKDKATEDEESILQLLVSNPASAFTDGLLYLNRTPQTLTNGSITILSDTSIQIKVDASVSGGLLEMTDGYYDVKSKIGSVVTLLTMGNFGVSLPVTKSI
jgi:hypothetical protein